MSLRSGGAMFLGGHLSEQNGGAFTERYSLLSAHRDYDIRTCLRSRLVMRDDIFSI